MNHEQIGRQWWITRSKRRKGTRWNSWISNIFKQLQDIADQWISACHGRDQLSYAGGNPANTARRLDPISSVPLDITATELAHFPGELAHFPRHFRYWLHFRCRSYTAAATAPWGLWPATKRALILITCSHRLMMVGVADGMGITRAQRFRWCRCGAIASCGVAGHCWGLQDLTLDLCDQQATVLCRCVKWP